MSERTFRQRRTYLAGGSVWQPAAASIAATPVLERSERRPIAGMPSDVPHGVARRTMRPRTAARLGR